MCGSQWQELQTYMGHPVALSKSHSQICLAFIKIASHWKRLQRAFEDEKEYFPKGVKCNIPIRIFIFNIFVKYSASAQTYLPCNPKGWLKDIENQWMLWSRLPIVHYESDSSMVLIPEVLLTSGDFVELDVKFDLIVDKNS